MRLDQKVRRGSHRVEVARLDGLSGLGEHPAVVGSARGSGVRVMIFGVRGPDCVLSMIVALGIAAFMAGTWDRALVRASAKSSL